MTAILDFLPHAEFYLSEGLQSGNAAYEILEPWVQWFHSFNGLKLRDLGSKLIILGSM